MSLVGEGLANQPNIALDFGVHIAQKILHLEMLRGFLADSLPTVQSLELTNSLLADAGRPDLAITDQATMTQISKPADILSCNNFTPLFVHSTGRRETSDLDWQNKPVLENIPATKDEVLALRQLPKLATYQDVRRVVESREFPALGSSGHRHGIKPAFTRMLVLFPEFTASLTVAMSNDGGRRWLTLEDDLYVAYQLMSHLVDKSDTYVTRDGEVDDYYLRR